MTPLGFEVLKVGHCRQNAHLACRAERWRMTDFPMLIGMLRHPRLGAVLFDTGYAPRFFSATERWPERAYRHTTPVTLPAGDELARQLAARGMRLTDIGTIVVSHFHADHVCGLRDLEGARILCARAGLQSISAAGRLSGARRGLLPALLPEDIALRADQIEGKPQVRLPDDLAPFGTGRDLLGDGSLLGIDLPGHADGQLGVVFIADDGRRVFLVADAAWSMRAIRENAPPTALASILLGHSQAYMQTLARLHELHRRNPAVLIVPSHCAERARELVR